MRMQICVQLQTACVLVRFFAVPTEGEHLVAWLDVFRDDDLYTTPHTPPHHKCTVPHIIVSIIIEQCSPTPSAHAALDIVALPGIYNMVPSCHEQAIEVEDCAWKEPWSLVDSVRIRRIKWLGGVLRRPATDVIRRVVLAYAKVVIRHRRQDRAAADNDVEEQAEPRVTRKGSRQARARVATIRNISVEDEMENALFAVPLRKQHVGSVILDEALPRWATEHQLLALAQDMGRWNYLLLLYL
jgi:hypothetical protein